MSDPPPALIVAHEIVRAWCDCITQRLGDRPMRLVPVGDPDDADEIIVRLEWRADNSPSEPSSFSGIA
jgi:hypothetical protein